MASLTENAFALLMWPVQAARLGSDLVETAAGAQRVIAARLPTIASAMRNPLTADHGELRQMVTEKLGAFRSSSRSLSAANAVVQRASSANAQALGRIAGGGLLWPSDWVRLAERNLAAVAAVAALPSETLAPYHAGVSANDKRLKR